MNQDAPKRWLVLGAGGRLGRALCTPARPWLIPADRRAVDATVPDAVYLALVSSDAYGVVNLAAAADVARCEREPEWAYTGNVLTARGAAIGTCRAGKPLVQVSTDYVFGGSLFDFPRARAPYGPDNNRAPVNVYGRSKAAAEDEACRTSAGWVGHRTVIARMSFLDDPPHYRWVIGGVRVTKEWIGDAADRLARFLQHESVVDEWNIGRAVHLTTVRDTTLAALVHERYPDVPVVPYEEGLKRLPYALPADLRLGGAWRPPP